MKLPCLEPVDSANFVVPVARSTARIILRACVFQSFEFNYKRVALVLRLVA